jgi:hypothetical protein
MLVSYYFVIFQKSATLTIGTGLRTATSVLARHRLRSAPVEDETDALLLTK